MHLENPEALLLALLLPLLLRKRSTSQGIAYSSPLSSEALAKTFSSIRSRTRRPVLQLIFALAFLSGVIALSRPQMEFARAEQEWSGRDLLLTLDISGSMQALDFELEGSQTDRLTALKHVITQFVDDRRGDRIGLVVFGDLVFTQSPLTLDHASVKSFVSELQVGMAGQGTAIGDAIAISLKRLRDIKANSKAIILVTDGKNNAGNVSPLEISALAKELGIRIYVVGVGGPEPAPFPVRSPVGVTMIVERAMEYDEETLKLIASTTNGKYFNAKDLRGLQDVYAEINQLETRSEQVSEQRAYQEVFRPFAIASLLMFCGYLILGSSLYRKVTL